MIFIFARKEIMHNYSKNNAHVFLLAFVFFTLISCDFVFEKNNKASGKQRTEIIESYKDDAKLLVKATQVNLDVVELIDVVKETVTDPAIKDIVYKLEKDQLKVFDIYKQSANENVISIPKTKDIKAYKDSLSLREAVNEISTKIDYQLEALKQLKATSKDSKFKMLASDAEKILQESLNKSQKLRSYVVVDYLAH